MGFSYKSSINFGLVYIPVRLEKAVKPSEISFNQLDKETMSRVTYIKSCRECDGKEVKKENIVKGYEYESGKYVIFDDADFEKIKTVKDKSITIMQFTDLAEIDPIYFDTPYYVSPSGGEKAFLLLLRILEKENKVGIAKTVLGTKETLVALRVADGKMLMYTLFFESEIKKHSAGELNATVSAAEENMAKMLVDTMTSKFDPSKYKDEYSEKVLEAINTKIAGKQISVPKERKENITDIMEAQKASLEQAGSLYEIKKPKPKPPQSKTSAAKKSPKNKNAMIAKGK